MLYSEYLHLSKRPVVVNSWKYGYRPANSRDLIKNMYSPVNFEHVLPPI